MQWTHNFEPLQGSSSNPYVQPFDPHMALPHTPVMSGTDTFFSANESALWESFIGDLETQDDWLYAPQPFQNMSIFQSQPLSAMTMDDQSTKGKERESMMQFWNMPQPWMPPHVQHTPTFPIQSLPDSQTAPGLSHSHLVEEKADVSLQDAIDEGFSEAEEANSTESSALSPRVSAPTSKTKTASLRKSVKSSTPTEKKQLTSQQRKANHVASERRRRQGIKESFKDLVDLLGTPEVVSAVYPDGVEPEVAKKKGRGRKGEAANGSTKFDIIQKACHIIRTLETDNAALRQSIATQGGHLSALATSSKRRKVEDA